MDFANDKDLFKFGLVVVAICLIPLFLYVYAHGGLKAALFAGWILLGVIGFIWMFARSHEVDLPEDSESFGEHFAAIWSGYSGYRIVISVLFFMFLFLTGGVWSVLEDWFPAAEMAVSSQMPGPGATPQ